jgi:hypothetical protein
MPDLKDTVFVEIDTVAPSQFESSLLPLAGEGLGMRVFKIIN